MHRLATTLDAVAATRSKKEKVAQLSQLLATLTRDEVAIAARLVLGQLLPLSDSRTPGVGWALFVSAASRVSSRSEAEIGLRTRELGDFGAALNELLPARSTRLALTEVPALLEALAATNERDQKTALLEGLLTRATPHEVRYLARALLNELRVGVQRGLFEEALAQAFHVTLETLRAASAVTPDAGLLALRAFDGTLDAAAITLFEPVSFMLATPIEQVKEPLDLALTVVEDKLDGVRTQAHVAEGKVRLFSRGQGEVTACFPEVVATLRALTAKVVLDGEVIAVTPAGRARPFQALQKRLGRSTVSRALQQSTPVAYLAWDVLWHDGVSLLSKPWAERRAVLEQLGVSTNPTLSFDPAQALEPQLDSLFTAARARGNEGLMLKRRDSLYEAGRRGSAWRKVKRAWATLDVVITRAERGHGRRAGVLSDYTFAVREGPTSLKEIGRAYSGLTDVELAGLTKRLEALTVSQHGPYHVVKPAIVLEVAFDGLQASTRHDSGFALRFPRIVRIRDDKTPAEADTLDTVRALFEKQVETGHREPTKQLSLF